MLTAALIGAAFYFAPSALVLVALIVAARTLRPTQEPVPEPLTREELDNALCEQHEPEFTGSRSMEQLAELYLIPTNAEGER